MHPSNNRRSILVGEDELEVRGYFEMVLKSLGYSVELAQDGDEVLACLDAPNSDIAAVLLDVMMPNRDGLDALCEIKRTRPGLPVIMISGGSSTPNVIAAMKNGATDFLCKPILHDELCKAITRALEAKPTDYVPPPRIQPATARAFVGKNPRVKEIHALASQVGWSDAPVLIQGETGTGKEVLARDLHVQSRRAKKLFLKLNCAALPSELVESELFGYERGAFTGAFQKKAGMFEMADGGTILLDEIGDMDVRLQAKLLQVLQDQEFQRIGGKEPIKVDVRVIAATHRDLEKSILEKTFREDLYYRLNVINIHLPPLRERKEDVIPLAEFLIKRHTSPEVPSPPLTPQLKNAMIGYNWPGNVRELENFVRKFLILRNSEMLANDLQAKVGLRANDVKPAPAPTPVTEIRSEPVPKPLPPILEHVTNSKRQAEAEAILSALEATHWNRKRAAALLHVDYKVFLYKIKRLHLDDHPESLASCDNTAPAIAR
jgi:two-component system response regulator AtoC